MSSTIKNIYIAGIGVISPLGCGLEATEQALKKNVSAIGSLTAFAVQQPPSLPVGQVQDCPDGFSPLPRTHNLAVIAAKQALENSALIPDVVILGTTTGGILTTENLLAENVQETGKYRYHGLTTVAEEVAKAVHCTGPALTVSTACSSGTVAISMAVKMLQSGKAEWVLAGGVDSLCRLTYFGFNSLQLVDPEGSKPMDANRQGMSVAEGAAILLLTTTKQKNSPVQILGCGLSCDAYHPASPHPDGKGAATAMKTAIQNSGIAVKDVDYINLHGTGTPDNDLAEAKAVHTVFPTPPPLSSIKGATGHGLAASGAIEAAIATICLNKNFLPANTGFKIPDPNCDLIPVLQPDPRQISVVLSNSFGFGGNNACLVIGKAEKHSAAIPTDKSATGKSVPLTILGKACITGAGHTKESMDKFVKLEALAGVLDQKIVSQQLPVRKIRRLKRFSRIALALAAAAKEDSGLEQAPDSVFLGSAWGALSETYNFLDKLQSSKEKFPSPIDFVGSVHNSAAGQIAIMYRATGANVTSSGGNYSFEQALLAADSFLDDTSSSAFVLAADEAHEQFSRLFDPSLTETTPLADGGGSFYLCRKAIPGKISVKLKFYQKQTENIVETLIAALDKNALRNDCAMILAGIPAADANNGEKQLDSFMQKTGLDVPVIHYRKFTGEFASASSVAAVMATHLLEEGIVKHDKKVLIVGFGINVTAMEFSRQ